MNTINPVRPYMTIKNNPQTPATQPAQPQAPAFKGVIGDRVVKQIAAKEAVTVAGIVGLAAGMIGLSKEKVSDMVESFVNRIKGLQAENENLTQQLKEEKTRAAQEKEAAMREFAADKQRMQDGITHALVEKNLEIEEKEAKIAELQKYEAMAKVKSVDELDIVSPEQFIELLQEAKEAQPVAEQSLLHYLFKGNGQEEFLAQIERSNQILKARSAGITEIQEMKEAYENVGIPIGFDSVYVAQRMMDNALCNNEAGAQINYAPVRKQIQENADAIINPMMEKSYHYTPNEEILEEVSHFYKNLSAGKAKMAKDGWKFEKKSVNSSNRPYYTYVNDKNEKYDIYLSDLANGMLGMGRRTLADGSVSSFANNGYWE